MPGIKPSIVIGAGGTGYWILSLLKRQLYINYGVDADETNEIKFLLMDTLAEEKFEREYQQHVKSIGEKFTIKRREYLHLGESKEGFFAWANVERNYKDPIYEWFRRGLFIENYPVEANWKLNEGAAQMRQFGRMAFYFNKARIKQAIINLLDEVKAAAGDTTIPVWIFGSFAGGTGAGLMLDLAILTKVIAKQRKISVRNIGGIVLPDVYSNTMQTSPAQGYSAFRELSRFLSRTDEKHRANTDGVKCAQVVKYDEHDKFYHNRFIFDNIIYFNKKCDKDEDRKDYFNKVADGLTILFDAAGAKKFFDEIINHRENRVTSISTYKVFIPLSLYIQLFTAMFLKDEIDKLFPNTESSTIQLPGEDRITEVRRDIKNFLNELSPYFMELSPLVDSDKEAREYIHNYLLEKPKVIFGDLFGYHTKEKYFGDEVNKPNYIEILESLFAQIYEKEKVPGTDDLKKEIKLRKKSNKEYSIEEYLKEFKARIDRQYRVYEKIFKKDNEDRKTIKDNILNHLKHQLKHHIKKTFDTFNWGIPEVYYFLKETVRILEGENDDSNGIRGLLNGIIKDEFNEYRANIENELNKISGKFTDLHLKKEKKLLGILGGEKVDYTGAAKLMKDYLIKREKYLRFEQSDNLISLLVELHSQFSNYVRDHILLKLNGKNSEISSDKNSIKGNLQSQVVDIRSVMAGGVGKASSMGIQGSDEESRKYESYLREKIFSEKPFTALKVIFDEQEENFLVKYTNQDKRDYYDNRDIETETGQKITFWNQVVKDIYQFIENKRLPNYEGIMHYLDWARGEYKNDEKFAVDLEKKLLKASDFIELIGNPTKSYRLIYGDKKASEFKLDDILKEVKRKLSEDVGTSVSDPSDSPHEEGQLDFGDKNSLIFFAYSNEIIPESIKVLKNMKDEYEKQIRTGSAVDWRSFVYHNFKCDWKIWEIERSLPDFKARGLKALTHGSFYWVLEEDEKVKLFVHCIAVGIIRLETSVDELQYWVCGPKDKTFEENKEVVLQLTEKSQKPDMFSALVNFAITQRAIDRIDKIDFEEIERIKKETLIKENQGGKLFGKIKDDYINNNEWITHYNKEVEVGDYEKHKKLFLARLFWFYLKEE